MGLSREAAVSCFDFCKAPESKLIPHSPLIPSNMVKERIVGPEITDCFIINRIKLTGGSYLADIKNSYAIYIVCEGEAKIFGENFEKNIKKGDYFFMPAICMGNFKIAGNAEIIECY